MWSGCHCHLGGRTWKHKKGILLLQLCVMAVLLLQLCVMLSYCCSYMCHGCPSAIFCIPSWGKFILSSKPPSDKNECSYWPCEYYSSKNLNLQYHNYNFSPPEEDKNTSFLSKNNCHCLYLCVGCVHVEFRGQLALRSQEPLAARVYLPIWGKSLLLLFLAYNIVFALQCVPCL